MLVNKKELLIDTGDKKKALLVRMSAYDITQAIPRAASTLQEMGYAITILSLDLSLSKPDIENVNGWRIFWYRHHYKSKDKLSFLWAWLCWWIWVIKHICRGEYTLIQASNLESIIPCVIAKKIRKFSLVFDNRDLWGVAYENPKNLLMRIFRMMERWGALHANGMVVSQGLLDKTGAYFGKKVCNQIICVQVLNVPGEDIAGQYYPPNLNGVRVNFSGHISYVRNAQAIIDLAKAIPDVQIDVSGGIRDVKLRKALEKVPNINNYGRVSYDKAQELMQKANLVAVMYNVNTLNAVILSANKMFEAMMWSRPYVASAGGFLGITAERYGVGWAIPYGDSQALIELVSDCITNPQKIEQKAKKGREVYTSHFTWNKQKSNLVLLYRHVVGDKQSEFFKHQGWKKILGTVI